MRLGKPPDQENYEQLSLEGLTVYLPQEFSSPFELTIEAHSFFGLFQTLHLEGWKVI